MSEEPKQGETDAEWLVRHGWTLDDEAPSPKWWRDPLVERRQTNHSNGEPFDDSFTVVTEDALTIQRARDEQEERAAWVQFAAFIRASIGDHPTEAAEKADVLLVEFRARFGRKVAP